MASYLDKFKIRTAVSEQNKFDMSSQHITTADFMQLSPIYSKEMVPGEKISIDVQSFSRVTPMAVPTFGRLNIHNRAFFVPFRTIWPGWNDFITDTPHVPSHTASAAQYIPQTCPTFTTNALMNAFASSSDLVTLVTGQSPSAADVIMAYGGSGSLSTTMFKYTKKGRQIVKILHSLGYNWTPDAYQGSEWDSFTYSALPLLAYVKVYLDWYYPSQYYQDNDRAQLEAMLKYDAGNVQALTATQLALIFKYIGSVNYDSDYFVSAFDNPVGPSNGAFSAYGIPDITNNRNVTNQAGGVGAVRVNTGTTNTYLPNNGTPVAGLAFGTGTANPPQISEYLLHSLMALTDYMKRHQLVGSRALDRYLARFGITLNSDKLNRSIYVGSQNFPLQIGDVMSQSSTSGAGLGDYAGKGLANGLGKFDFETKEYGMFVIMNSIVPTAGYYQGIDRNVLHKERLDFWTPEFDQLGTQPINSFELIMSEKDGLSNINSGLTTQIFGFAPRYAEYKIARDRLTGDWRIPTLVNGGPVSDAWHLMRQFDISNSFSADSTNVVHSKTFVQGEDANQYARIFQYVGDDADHFIMIHNFNVASWMPMKKLYDTYDFHYGGKDDVNVDVNGVKVN